MNNCAHLPPDSIELGESTDILSQIPFTGIANLTIRSRSLNSSPTLSQRGSQFTDSGQFGDLSPTLSPREFQFTDSGQFDNLSPTLSPTGSQFTDSGQFDNLSPTLSPTESQFTDSGQFDNLSPTLSSRESQFTDSGQFDNLSPTLSPTGSQFTDSGQFDNLSPTLSPRESQFTDSGQFDNLSPTLSPRESQFTDSGQFDNLSLTLSPRESQFTDSGQFDDFSLTLSPRESQFTDSGQFDNLSPTLSPTESQFVERSQYPNFAPSDNDIIPSHHFVPNQHPEPVNVNIHSHNSNLPTQASNQNNMSHFPHNKLRSGPNSLTVQQMANEGSGFQVSKLPQAPFRKKFTPNVQGLQLKKDIDKIFGFHVSKKRFFPIYEDISATTGMLPLKIDRSRYRCGNKLYADIFPYREILLANITQEHIAMVRESKNKARVANLLKKNGFNH